VPIPRARNHRRGGNLHPTRVPVRTAHVPGPGAV
jgi:hypothetical protein